MRTPSGILHVVDFKTDQIVAAIQPQDYWDDKRQWEIKNNVDMLFRKNMNLKTNALNPQNILKQNKCVSKCFN